MRTFRARLVERALELEAGGNVEDERGERRGFFPDDGELVGRRLGAAQQRVAHRGFAKGARRLGDGHAVAALALGQVAHRPSVEGVAELVGEDDHVGRAAGVRHVHPRRARFAKSRAVGAGEFAVPHRAFYPPVARHRAYELAHARMGASVRLGDEVDGRGVGDVAAAFVALRRRGAQVPRAVAALPVGFRLQRRRPARQRPALLGDAEHRVQRGAFDAVGVYRRVQEMQGAHAPRRGVFGTPPAHLQAPAGDGVDRRRAGFLVFFPRGVDRAPRPFAQRVVRPQEQGAGRGQAHFPLFAVDPHRAGERSGELVVKTAPSVDAVLRQGARQGLLRERQNLVTALARVRHLEARRRHRVGLEKPLHHGVRRQIQKLRQRRLRLVKPLLCALHAPAQRLRRVVLAVHAQHAIGVGVQIVQQTPRLFEQREDRARNANRLAGSGRIQHRPGFQQRQERLVALLDRGNEVAQSRQIAFHFGRVRRRVFAGEIPPLAVEVVHRRSCWKPKPAANLPQLPVTPARASRPACGRFLHKRYHRHRCWI